MENEIESKQQARFQSITFFFFPAIWKFDKMQVRVCLRFIRVHERKCWWVLKYPHGDITEHDHSCLIMSFNGINEILAMQEWQNWPNKKNVSHHTSIRPTDGGSCCKFLFIAVCKLHKHETFQIKATCYYNIAVLILFIWRQIFISVQNTPWIWMRKGNF